MGIEQHPNYSTLMTLINTLISKVSAKQSVFLANNTKYFQGISIPSGNPDGTGVGLVIDPTVKPTDQNFSWGDFDSVTFKKTTKLPFKIQVDVCSGYAGKGWVLSVHIWKSGLDPDSFGAMGSHWIYQHYVGEPSVEGIWDKWYIYTVRNFYG